MEVEIGDQNLFIRKHRAQKLKKATEFLRLSLYIFTRKLLKAQSIFLILFGIVCATLLISILYYSAGKNATFDHKNSISRKVNTAFNIKKKQHNFDFHKIQHKKYPVYYDDGLRTEWPFKISKQYETGSLRYWTAPLFSIRQIRRVNYYGENGTAFIAPDDKKQLMEQLYKQHNYNLFASQMISLHRSLPDLRFAECKELSYPDELPTTSVIVIFHNEAWSTLLRTVWSIIDRSPHELIKEIILVDDFSTEKILKKPLDNYIKIFSVHVKIIRTKQREGLIRSRLLGAKMATVSLLYKFSLILRY